MEFNKSFKTLFKYSKEEIIQFESKNELKIPNDYLLFLTKHGGKEINDEEYEYDLCVTIDRKLTVAPFIGFFDLEYMQSEIDDIKEEEELFADLSPLDKFLPIAHAHGQYRITTGVTSENKGRIFLLDIERDNVEFICDNLVDFIDFHLVPADELEDWG